MTEVLKALRELNVSWKKIGPYNMKCRWSPGIPGHYEGMVNISMHSNRYFGDDSSIIENEGLAKSPDIVKFEVQVIFFCHIFVNIQLQTIINVYYLQIIFNISCTSLNSCVSLIK